MNLEAERLCSEYRKELERLYGKKVAEKSIVDYFRGWFRIGIARTYSDGSVGNADFVAQSYRKVAVIGMIARLKERKPKNELP